MHQLIDEARKIQGEFKLNKDFSAGAVSAALLTGSNNIYTGICIELACGIGFCAEHSAIAEMLKNRETVIETIVAVSKNRILPPCGRCRELMVQVDKRNLDTRVIISEDETIRLKNLIPYSWMD